MKIENRLCAHYARVRARQHLHLHPFVDGEVRFGEMSPRVGNYGVNPPCFRPIVPRFFGASASLVSNLSIVCKNIFSFSALFS